MTRNKAIAAFVALAMEYGGSPEHLERLYRAPAHILGPDLWRWWSKYTLAKSTRVIISFQDDCSATLLTEKAEAERIAKERLSLTPFGAIAHLVSGLLPFQRERIRTALESWEESFGEEPANLAKLRPFTFPRGKAPKLPPARVTAIRVCGIALPKWAVEYLNRK